MEQDPTDPTGVRDDSPRGNSEVARARARKANAALEMRLKNHSWDEVAETLGYPTPRHALIATESALESGLLSAESQEFMRRTASEQLQRLLQAVYTEALNDENPAQLAYHDRATKVIAQHAKLNGYEAPQEYVVNNPSTAALEQWVATALAQNTTDVEEADIFEAEVVEDEDLQSTEDPEPLQIEAPA